jgi:hypothetical protein
LIRFTDNQHSGLGPKARWINHGQAQFSLIGLAEKWHTVKKEKKAEFLHE